VGLLAAALLPVFYAGLVTLLDAAARGTPARAGAVLAGFTVPGAFARLLPLVALQVALLLVLSALVRQVAGPELVALANAAGANAKQDPALVLALLRKLVPVLGALFPVWIGAQWVQMLAVPRAMAGVPGLAALGDAVVGVWRNVGAFVVNLACQLMLAFALSLAFAMLAVVAALLGALGQVLLLIVCMATAFAINAAVMARAAHEVFATDAPPDVPAVPPGGPDHIEA
jgi:hypothetical protein